MNWYFQYTPRDICDYDQIGIHILIDGTVNGEPRKLVTLSMSASDPTRHR